MIVLFILAAVGGKHFNTGSKSAIPEGFDSSAITANRLSFFALQMSVPLSWAGAGSDFFVYYPENTSKRLLFLMTTIGLWLSFVLVNIIGIGLASGSLTNPAWEEAYVTSPGALILAGFGMGRFGKFCATIIALGANLLLSGLLVASLCYARFRVHIRFFFFCAACRI